MTTACRPIVKMIQLQELIFTTLAIAGCILLFAAAVLIHEFGHFIAAKALGLRVEAFSIFFGKPVWKKKVGDCEYRIGWLPLGGYVALPDLDPDGTKAIEGAGEAAVSAAAREVPAWKKILVAFAGPLGNIVLAVALAFVLSCLPADKFGACRTVIGAVAKDSPALEAGVKPGDRVLAVDGKAVSTWYEMQVEIQLAGGKTIPFTVLRDGREITLNVTPVQDEASGVWIILAFSADAGHPPWMAERDMFKQLEFDFCSIARVLKALVTPKESGAAAKAIGGPINIAESLYRQVRNDKADAIGFLRFLNVNLAMLNLLPIPVLDGGLILFALIELLSRRKLNKKIVNFITMAFMYVLLAMMGLVIVHDVVRSYSSHTAERPKIELAE